MSFLADNPRPVLDFFVKTEPILAASRDYFTTLKNVAKACVPFLGDWCIIDLYDPISDELDRIAIYHADDRKQAFARSLERRPPPDRKDSPVGARNVLRTLKAELIPKVDWRELVRGVPDPLQLMLIKRLGIESTLCVPMLIRQSPIGVITLVSGSPGRSYSLNDLPVAEQLARLSALYVDNSRLGWELSSALQLRDHLLTLMSHDLRNPLSAIQLAADLMSRRKDLTPGALELLVARIKHACGHLGDLINDLVSFRESKLSEQPVRTASVDVLRVLDRCIAVLGGLAQTRGVAIECASEENLAREASTDPRRVQSIFSFLIQNSIFALRSGGLIRVHPRNDGDVLMISIEVIGEKLDVSQFEPGYTAAREMCSDTGCRFDYRNVGKGVEFRFAFPLEKAPENPELGQPLRLARMK